MHTYLPHGDRVWVPANIDKIPHKRVNQLACDFVQALPDFNLLKTLYTLATPEAHMPAHQDSHAE